MVERIRSKENHMYFPKVANVVGAEGERGERKEREEREVHERNQGEGGILGTGCRDNSAQK